MQQLGRHLLGAMLFAGGLLLIASPAQALDADDTKLFTTMLAPSGAIIYPIKSKSKGAHAYSAEFNPSDARIGKKKPKLGLQTLISEQYAIVSYFARGKCLFASGGSRADQTRSGWSLTDCSGKAINRNDPRIQQFVFATIPFLGFTKSVETPEPPAWVPFDNTAIDGETVFRSFVVGDAYAAQVGGTDWASIEIVAMTDQANPAMVSFFIHLINDNKLRILHTQAGQVIMASDEPFIADQSTLEADVPVTDLNPQSMTPLTDPAVDSALAEFKPRDLLAEPDPDTDKDSESTAQASGAFGSLLKSGVKKLFTLFSKEEQKNAPRMFKSANRAGHAASRKTKDAGLRRVRYNAARNTYLNNAYFLRGKRLLHGNKRWNACLKANGCVRDMQRQMYRKAKPVITWGRKYKSDIFHVFSHGYCGFQKRYHWQWVASGFAEHACEILHATNPLGVPRL